MIICKEHNFFICMKKFVRQCGILYASVVLERTTSLSSFTVNTHCLQLTFKSSLFQIIHPIEIVVSHSLENAVKVKCEKIAKIVCITIKVGVMIEMA